jgi:hypothetical protein
MTKGTLLEATSAAAEAEAAEEEQEYGALNRRFSCRMALARVSIAGGGDLRRWGGLGACFAPARGWARARGYFFLIRVTGKETWAARPQRGYA